MIKLSIIYKPKRQTHDSLDNGKKEVDRQFV
jgi:hypothetical protein